MARCIPKFLLLCSSMHSSLLNTEIQQRHGHTWQAQASEGGQNIHFAVFCNKAKVRTNTKGLADSTVTFLVTEKNGPCLCHSDQITTCVYLKFQYIHFLETQTYKH